MINTCLRLAEHFEYEDLIYELIDMKKSLDFHQQKITDHLILMNLKKNNSDLQVEKLRLKKIYYI